MRRRELLKIPKWCNNPIGVNILDISKREEGCYVTGADANRFGATKPYNGYAVSGYIKVIPGEVYRATWTKGSSTGWGMACTYSKDKIWLGNLNRTTYHSADEIFTIPENCYYIRLDLDEISKLTEQGVITLVRIS